MKKYPIYTEDEKNVQPGIYLGLFHGFKNEEERRRTDDWGECGAMIGPLKFVHTTYGWHIKLHFLEGADVQQYGFGDNAEDDFYDLKVNDNGCIEFDGMQYGDWTVYYTEGKK